MNSRKLALTLHRVVGILVGRLLVISGLTGSSIVFQEEIDRALNAGGSQTRTAISLWDFAPWLSRVS